MLARMEERTERKGSGRGRGRELALAASLVVVVVVALLLVLILLSDSVSRFFHLSITSFAMLCYAMLKPQQSCGSRRRPCWPAQFWPPSPA